MTLAASFRSAIAYVSGSNRNVLVRAIAEFYKEHGYHLLRVNSLDIPLITREEWTPEEPVPLSEVGLEWVDNPPPLTWRWDGLADELREECGLIIMNNPTYRLLEVRSEFTMVFSLGNYMDFIETCGALEWEIATKLAEMMKNTKIAYCKLPKRVAKILHKDLKFRRNLDPLSLENRSSAVGVNTLTIINEESSYYVLIHQRGKRTAEGRDILHVIPAGTFQPMERADRHHDIEFSLEWNIAREFAEELLGLERALLELYNSDPENYYRYIRAVLNALRSHSDMYFMGIGIDPLNLKPQILTTMIIYRSDLVSRIRMEKCWEGSSVRRVPFDKGALKDIVANGHMSPSGEACLAIALKNKRKLT